MKKIMILAGRYLPGYKDGGPVRTIKNVTDSIGDMYEFSVVCNDRDHGDAEKYSGVQINEYNNVGKAAVYYVGDGKFTFRLIKKLANQHDLLYVCGPYNGYAIKALILNKLHLIKCPFVLAPMGSFSKGALAIKNSKKKIFLSIFKTLGMFNRVYFSVTSPVEEKELREVIPVKTKCYIAEDMQRNVDLTLVHGEYKKDNMLNLVFISRICEKKNLSMAIDVLMNVSEPVKFHIYGNIEDEEYWKLCQDKLSRLPNNIEWKYTGELNSEEVVKTLSLYDAFLFPTLGENFGHVISEAMSAGCIPVISDTTPWLDIEEKQAGWVIPLFCHKDETDCREKMNDFEFSTIITQLCKMTKDEIAVISKNAREYSTRKYEESISNNGYVEMFDELIR